MALIFILQRYKKKLIYRKINNLLLRNSPLFDGNSQKKSVILYYENCVL